MLYYACISYYSLFSCHILCILIEYHYIVLIVPYNIIYILLYLITIIMYHCDQELSRPPVPASCVCWDRACVSKVVWPPRRRWSIVIESQLNVILKQFGETLQNIVESSAKRQSVFKRKTETEYSGIPLKDVTWKETMFACFEHSMVWKRTLLAVISMFLVLVWTAQITGVMGVIVISSFLLDASKFLLQSTF